MQKAVLVTGGESPMGAKLIEKLLEKDYRVAASTDISSKEVMPPKLTSENLVRLVWNPGSWFSAKTVAREVIRKYQRLDAAWILHCPPWDLRSFADIGSADIERVLEHVVKGAIALTREILPLLEETSGFLGLIAAHGSGGALNALAEGAFLGFAEAIIKETSPRIWSCGMQSPSPDDAAFTESIVNLCEDRPPKLRGRWYCHTGKPRMLGQTSFSDSPKGT